MCAQRHSKQAKLSIFLFICSLAFNGCGIEDKLEDSENKGSGQQSIVENSGQTSKSKDITDENNVSSLEKGQVFVQRLQLAKAQKLSSQISPAREVLGLTDKQDVSLEISIVDENGKELSYERDDLAGGDFEFIPPTSGVYDMIIRTNEKTLQDIPKVNNVGAMSESNIVVAGQQSPLSNIILKGVVVLARKCVQLDQNANSQIVLAPSGRYFVQPMIFYGRVNDNKEVELLSSATMTIETKETMITLKNLQEMKRSQYRDIYFSNSSLTDDEERNLTRIFYQGYFGAAGELYTVETFRKGGICDPDNATIALSGDIGANDVSLRVIDQTLGVDRVIQLRPTIQPSFSMYESNESKLSDWTQCSYDRQTGEPKTYNGDAKECKNLSLSDPPYVTLDYLLPSATSDGIASGLSALSDPTRILYYGHSYAKSWYQQLINHASELIDTKEPSVTIERCLYNGGLVAIPLQNERADLPLKEFNAQAGDVINLSKRSGSHTALLDFYQGDVSIDGQYQLASCIPGDSSDCEAYKQIMVKVQNCSIKADSAISVTSIADSFIYPDYFEISGVIVE